MDYDSLAGEAWMLAPREVAALIEKLDQAGEPLGDGKHVIVLRGIVTGLNKAFFIGKETRERLIAQDARSAEAVKPLVVGSDIGAYAIESKQAWILYLPHGVDISRYPAIRGYLKPFRVKLEKRATKQAWYELQQPQNAYREFFEGAKIIYPEIATEPQFAFDAGPLYPNNKCFFIPGQNPFLLALLNSRLVFFYLQQTLARLEGKSNADRYLEFRAQYMERLPIPRIEGKTPPDTRHERTERLQSFYFESLRSAGVVVEGFESSDSARERGEESGEGAFAANGNRLDETTASDVGAVAVTSLFDEVLLPRS